MRLKIFPYKMGSKSAKALANNLGILRLYSNRRYKSKARDLIINWGNSQLPPWDSINTNWINHPINVHIASNKLLTLNELKLREVNVPEYTTDIEQANDWINSGSTVVCRHTLTGHSGSGITLHTEHDMVRCPLYTKHIRHKREFRVHVFKTTIIDATEKKKRRDFEANILVRSHINGWTFCREDVIIPICVLTEAIKAVRALGLDFGAVDVGYKENEDKAYIFEVNTAPGLEGTTLTRYTEALYGL